MTRFKRTAKYVFVSMIAVFLTYFLHEACHWIAGEMLGYPMKMTLNSASLVEGEFAGSRDAIIVSAAGPLFTIIQAAVVYIIMKRNKSVLLYPFLFNPLYMRALAGALNFINLNDEGRISSALGLGAFTLSIGVCTLLLFFVFRISRQEGYSAKFQLINLLLTMLLSSVLVLADQFFHLRVI